MVIQFVLKLEEQQVSYEQVFCNEKKKKTYEGLI